MVCVYVGVAHADSLCDFCQADATSQNRVIVTAGDSTANFYWPTDSLAAAYIIDVRNSDGVACHLTLDAACQQPYCVEGLACASKYFYTVAAIDDNEVPLHVYQGWFETNGYVDYPTGEGDDSMCKDGEEIVPTPPIIPYDPVGSSLREIHTGSVSNIVLLNGQVYIMIGQQIFSVSGQRVH